MKMKIKKLHEGGKEAALLGLGLSWHLKGELMPEYTSLERVANKLAHKDGGHNKFLESIFTHWLIVAPRYWWSEADTYRISTKQSESTMHTLKKRLLSKDDFADGVNDAAIAYVNTLIARKASINEVKANLPEGFLQTRTWVLSYKTLRNIIEQRRNHKLIEWSEFIAAVYSSVDNKEWLPEQ
jgi:hypothetical protein